MTKKDEKLRRMQVRRDIGNREIHKPIASSSHPEYLIAFACFECRKSFKKPVNGVKQKCPQCGEVFKDMGRSFKTPKTRDVDQWTKVQRLWEAGFRFVGNGWHDSPKLPEQLNEVDQFIAENPIHHLRFDRD